MLQVALMVNRKPIDDIPADYQLQLPSALEAQGDAVLGANYVATTPKQVAAGGAGAGAGAGAGGGGAGAGEAMEVGTGEEGGDEEAPPRTARRGEKNLRLMMNTSASSSS